MMRVALLGASGYVGQALERALAGREGIELTSVVRANYDEKRAFSYDVVINSAMPSGRFSARKAPLDDFRDSVQKTANILYGWQTTKIVQISSLSARCQTDTVYGRHRLSAEALLDGAVHLVVRLGPMFGGGLAKGVLIDLLHNRQVFVAADSRYAFCDVDVAASHVVGNLHRVGNLEIAARDSLLLSEVARFLDSRSTFTGPTDVQALLEPRVELPPASDVFRYLTESRAAMTSR